MIFDWLIRVWDIVDMAVTVRLNPGTRSNRFYEKSESLLPENTLSRRTRQFSYVPP